MSLSERLLEVPDRKCTLAFLIMRLRGSIFCILAKSNTGFYNQSER